MATTARVQLGVVSDTHDRFDPALRKLFAGVDFILHAGDIVGPEVLETLEAIAPVRAVRGNNDVGGWAEPLPAARVERFLEVPVLVVHILGTVAEPTLAVRFLIEAEKPRVVVSGHSHKALLEVKDGMLFFNPGSAGPARFKLKPAAGLLTIQKGRVLAEIYALEDGEARKLSEQAMDLL
jgi:putative phosphoesterase